MWIPRLCWKFSTVSPSKPRPSFACCKMDRSTPHQTSSLTTPSAEYQPSRPTFLSYSTSPLPSQPETYFLTKAPPPLPPTYITSTQELPPPPSYVQDPELARGKVVPKLYVYKSYYGLRMTTIICFGFFGLMMVGIVVLIIVLSVVWGF